MFLTKLKFEQIVNFVMLKRALFEDKL